MSTYDTRLECLQLAVRFSKPVDETVAIAQKMADFVLNGASKPKAEKGDATHPVHGVV